MEELIRKRKKCFEQLDEINKKIDSKAQEYFNQKVLELSEETEKFKLEIRKEFEEEINTVNFKIKVIDEIISEEMPEVKSIEELLKQEPKTDEIVEETVDENEETIEENTEVKDEEITETDGNIVNVCVNEDDIITIEEVNEIPKDKIIIDSVEIISEEIKNETDENNNENVLEEKAEINLDDEEKIVEEEIQSTNIPTPVNQILDPR